MCLVIWDTLSLFTSGFLAFLLLYEGRIPTTVLLYPKYLPILIAVINFVVFLCFRLYFSLWNFASFIELKNIILATLSTVCLELVIFTYLDIFIPKSWYPINWMIFFIMITGSRFLYRLSRIFLQEVRMNSKASDENRVLIVGAGEAGAKISREILLSDKTNKKVMCFIDDMPSKKGMRLHGIPIYGGREKINEAVEKYKVNEIIIALPSVPMQHKKDIIEMCNDTK